MKSPVLTHQIPTFCDNCGTELTQANRSKIKRTVQGVEEEVEVYTCPVCYYQFSVDDIERKLKITSREEFEGKLRTIIQQANQGGVTLEEIIETLREELEFTAEWANPNCRFTVQIINLGNEDYMTVPTPHVVDYRDKLIKQRYHPT